MRLYLCLLLFLSAFATAQTEAVEILHWNRLPLTVALVVDDERVVIIGHPLRVGLPESLDGRLRVQSADGAVYLLAKAPIETTELELQDLRTGELILIDVTARAPLPHEAPLEPVRIIDDVGQHENDNAVSSSGTLSAGESTDARPIAATPVTVALTRYAAQSLYAPLRTVEPLPGVSVAPVLLGLRLDALLPTLPVRAKALAAWRLSGECVTAIMLTNTSSRWISLDSRLLQGDFIAATFQHPDLGPAGHSTDTTVVYLITRGSGIAESLLPHASRFDATLALPKVATSAASGQAENRRP